MDGVYRRENLPHKRKGKKKKNEHARKRNIIMNFRVTPEEKAMIDARIRMTGLPRGKFFIDSCLHQEITVIGNVRTFLEIENQLGRIEGIVRGDVRDGLLTEEDVENFDTILQIMDRRNRLDYKLRGGDDNGTDGE